MRAIWPRCVNVRCQSHESSVNRHPDGLRIIRAVVFNPHPIMRTLICGSLAFDSIMVFQDHFKNHILPDKIHMLNVSFLVPEMRREYGGCAGNIAYNLKLLGGEPLIMATVGDDFGGLCRAPRRPGDSARLHPPCRRHLHRAGLHHHRPRRQPDHRLPPWRDELFARERRAPGAGRQAGHRRPGWPRRHAAPRARLPRGRAYRASSTRARACRCFPARNCSSASTSRATSSSTTTRPNCCKAAPGENLATLARHVEALIVTRGGGRLGDPHGRQTDRHSGGAPGGHPRPHRLRRRLPQRHPVWHRPRLDWETAGQLASVMGAIKIEHRGGQNHKPTRDDIAARLKAAFGKTF